MNPQQQDQLDALVDAIAVKHPPFYGPHEAMHSNARQRQRTRSTIPPRALRAIQDACTDHGVSPDDVLGDSRIRLISAARHDAMWRVRQLRAVNHEDRPAFSLPQIGKMFGGRDHATVLYGVGRHAAQIGIDALRGSA